MYAKLECVEFTRQQSFYEEVFLLLFFLFFLFFFSLSSFFYLFIFNIEGIYIGKQLPLAGSNDSDRYTSSLDRKSTRLNPVTSRSRMPSSA